MNTYSRSFTFNQKYRSTKKLLITLGIILAVCFAIVMIIGLIADSDSLQNQNISDAIAENTQLKYTIEEQKAQIEELNAQIQSLNNQLEGGVVIEEEEPYTPDDTNDGEDEPQPSVENPQTPRDELDN